MNVSRTYRRINKALRLAQSGDAENVLAAALEILSTRIKHGDAVNSPAAVRDYLRLLLHDREHEIFVVVLLDLCVALTYVQHARRSHWRRDPFDCLSTLPRRLDYL